MDAETIYLKLSSFVQRRLGLDQNEEADDALLRAAEALQPPTEWEVTICSPVSDATAETTVKARNAEDAEHRAAAAWGIDESDVLDSRRLT